MNIDKWVRTKALIPIWLKYRKLSYGEELDFIRSLHERSLEEIRKYQLERIKALISYAYENVPFYRNEWRSLGLEPGDVKSYADFENLPVLTKKIIRENWNDLISTSSRQEQLIKSGTGGTTDSPITILYSYERARIKEAEMHFFREWFNWLPGDRVAYLWGAPQDIANIESLRYRLTNRLTYRKLHLFSSLMNSSIMRDFVEKLNRFRPDILQAYSNPAFILASYIQRNHLEICSPKAIVLTAEPCHPSQRRTIEEAFKTEVFTFYGCREGGYVGCECGYHSGYHINCSSIYLEVLKDGRKAWPDELGSIVFTDLYNFDMPFIRYEIGDLGSSTGGNCSCESSLPLIRFFAGRETDVFVTPDGEYVPGVSLCDRIIEDCKGIEQMQFIQNRPEELVVKIVKGPSYSEKDLHLLDLGLGRYFKRKLAIRKMFVDEIPKERSGKTRFCISNVDKRI
jgi:phenylacetate-CoA ligase